MKIRRYECQDCGSLNIDWARCSLEDCDEAAFARGWCKRHYTRWWRYGDPDAPDQRGRHSHRADEDFKALDEAPIWEGVDQHTKERLNVA